jgi:multiple sugar transport system substrate-binding protein
MLQSKIGRALIATCLAAAAGSVMAQGTKELVVAAVAGGETKGLKAVAPLYAKEKGIRLKILESPYPTLFEKLVTTFQAGNATYDMVMLDDPWMPKLGTNNWLTPLDTTYGIKQDPDIPQVVYDVGSWPPPHGAVPPSERSKERHLYGVTIVGNVEMFMYRKDMSAEPKSWDDVLANAKKLNGPDMAGYIIRGSATNPVVADFLPILWSFGGDIFDQDWNVTIDSPASLKAVKFLVQDLKAVAEKGAESTDAADRSRLMAIGKGYQSTVWPGEVTSILMDSKVSKVGDKVAYIPIPAGPSGKGYGMMGNWLLAIPKTSKHGKEAAAFIEWLASPRIQKVYAQGGGIPIRKSVLNDPALAAKNPYFGALAKSLDAGPNWRPRTDQWNAVETVLGTQLNAALAGISSPEDAMKKAAGEIHDIMDKAGYYKK